MSYDNTNRWTLNKNDRKKKDTHPDYCGSLNIDGVEYWLDAWLKEGRNGKFFSGVVKPKEQRSDEPRRDEPRRDEPRSFGMRANAPDDRFDKRGGQSRFDGDMEDDVPFLSCDPRHDFKK